MERPIDLDNFDSLRLNHITDKVRYKQEWNFEPKTTNIFIQDTKKTALSFRFDAQISNDNPEKAAKSRDCKEKPVRAFSVEKR